jgi:hypothetical protein
MTKDNNQKIDLPSHKSKQARAQINHNLELLNTKEFLRFRIKIFKNIMRNHRMNNQKITLIFLRFNKSLISKNTLNRTLKTKGLQIKNLKIYR